jgi:hypothetical protein
MAKLKGSSGASANVLPPGKILVSKTEEKTGGVINVLFKLLLGGLFRFTQQPMTCPRLARARPKWQVILSKIDI